MKNYLRTQITLYEEDKNYPIWRRQERRSKYAVQLASWQLRSNSPKTSVCLSVHPSVTPFWQCSCHRIILKFSGDFTIDKCDVYAKGQGQSLKVKVTEVMTPLSRFRTATPVWIHIWQWNYAQSLMLLRRGALLFFMVILKHFQTETQVSCHRWLWNDAQSLV